MPTPSIQTLRADAQQVLNLDSISAVRSVVAATLANANAGTPLNPNLTTQQLWNEFYQIVTQPKSDIESIIANQLMKFLFAPPAPGGAGADKQVIFNDGGVLAGDPQFLWNKTTNLLTVTGAATITGDLTVDTSTLKVDSANDRVGIGTATPANTLEVVAPAGDNIVSTFRSGDATAANNAGGGFRSISSATAASRVAQVWLDADGANFSGGDYFFIQKNGGSGTVEFNQSSNAAMVFLTNSTERMRIDSSGNVGVGDAPAANTRLTLGSVNPTGLNLAFKTTGVTTGRVQTYLGNTSGDLLSGIEGSTAGQTLTGSAAYSGFIGTFTNNPFYLVSNGLIRATIDTSGNLGIGVTPSAWASGNKFIDINSSAAFGAFGSSDAMMIGNAYWNGSSWIRKTANNAWRFVIESVSSTPTMTWQLAANGSAGSSITWTQAMTLDASGRLFVGATSITAGYTGNNYFVVGGVTSPTIKLQSTTGPAAWDIYSAGGADLFVAYNASDKGQFNSSTGVYTALSDANKKKDFEPSNIGLAEVLKLKPTLFRMIGAADDSAKELGFVAQDVQSVIPQAYVETESQGGKFIGLQDRPIIAALTRAIQELTARVQTLETR